MEPELWVYLGAKREVIEEALSRIERSKGIRRNPDQPDTQIGYGPGNWIYEFTLAGEDALHRVKAAGCQEAALSAYQEALVYFHTAAIPVLQEPKSLEAFERAADAYQAAAELLPGAFERVRVPFSGKSFELFLQIPPGEGPFPVLVLSNGSDRSSLNAFAYYRKHLLPKGIAFLTLDVPGMGRSRQYDVSDGKSDKLMVEAVRWAKANPELDGHNVFLQGVSFGGNSAARIFLAHSDELNLAGVIYICGPIHKPFTLPPEAYLSLPKFTMDGLRARLGLSPDASPEETARAVSVLSLFDQGLLTDGGIRTPILALENNRDPVAPLEDMDRMLSRADHADRVVFDRTGHCPPTPVREPIVAAWISEHLR